MQQDVIVRKRTMNFYVELLEESDKLQSSSTNTILHGCLQVEDNVFGIETVDGEELLLQLSALPITDNVVACELWNVKVDARDGERAMVRIAYKVNNGDQDISLTFVRPQAQLTYHSQERWHFSVIS
jgi:hypothetical protein